MRFYTLLLHLQLACHDFPQRAPNPARPVVVHIAAACLVLGCRLLTYRSGSAPLRYDGGYNRLCEFWMALDSEDAHSVRAGGETDHALDR